MTEQRSTSEAFIDAAQDVVQAAIEAGSRVAREVVDAGTDAARTVRRSLKDAVDTSLGDGTRSNGAGSRSTSKRTSA